MVDFVNCEQYIYVLFMVPRIIFFSNFFIKNGFHNTIYIFKNYFATVFSVLIFCFNKNKLNSNTLVNNCFNWIYCSANQSKSSFFRLSLSLYVFFGVKNWIWSGIHMLDTGGVKKDWVWVLGLLWSLRTERTERKCVLLLSLLILLLCCCYAMLARVQIFTLRGKKKKKVMH